MQPRVRLSLAPGAGVLGLVVAFLLAAALIYQSNAAWLLLWLVVCAVAASLVATLRNLRRVRVVDIVAPPVAAGDLARITAVLQAEVPAWNVTAAFPAFAAASAPVHPGGPVAATAEPRSLQRGVHRIHGVLIASTYPIGLFRAELLLPIPAEVVVHPRPAEDAPEQPGVAVRDGEEDFHGHRTPAPGEPPRRLDWRAHARGRPLLAKRFSSPASGAAAAVRWEDAQGGEERRLAVLTRWWLSACAVGVPVALELPGARLAPGASAAHRDAGLRLLAAHGSRT